MSLKDPLLRDDFGRGNLAGRWDGDAPLDVPGPDHRAGHARHVGGRTAIWVLVLIVLPWIVITGAAWGLWQLLD